MKFLALPGQLSACAPPPDFAFERQNAFSPKVLTTPALVGCCFTATRLLTMTDSASSSIHKVFIYSVTNWNTPHILDMRGATSLIVQAETHFLALDTAQGVQVSQVVQRPCHFTCLVRHTHTPPDDSSRVDHLVNTCTGGFVPGQNIKQAFGKFLR